MKISEKFRQINDRINAAHLQGDKAALDAAYAALDRLYIAEDHAIDYAEVTHYDFCTGKYRGNAVFAGEELVSAYLRENVPAKDSGTIRLSWSWGEEDRGLGCSDGTDPEAVARYARMYGRRRVTRGDLRRYLPDYVIDTPDIVWYSTLLEEVDK